MYKVFLGDVLLPFAPAAIKLQIKNKNKTVDLINEGEVNQLRLPGLTQIEFKFDLPYQKYPFVANFKPQKYFLDHLERLKVSKKPFQFIVVREGGFGTNLKVSLEDYTIEESAANARDVLISVKLKQYVDYGLKTVIIPETPKVAKTVVALKTPKTAKTIAPPAAPRAGTPKKKGKTYKVKRGDCLWSIARRFYGKGSLWRKIYNANRAMLVARNKGKRVPYGTIYAGQILRIPK